MTRREKIEAFERIDAVRRARRLRADAHAPVVVDDAAAAAQAAEEAYYRDAKGFRRKVEVRAVRLDGMARYFKGLGYPTDASIELARAVELKDAP